MFRWSLLLTLAPDLVPIIIDTILDVESAVKGIMQGKVKKEKVMEVIKAVLQTKDYFTSGNDSETALIYGLVSDAIDFFVKSFNYLGLFQTSKKVDFTKTDETPSVSSRTKSGSDSPTEDK